MTERADPKLAHIAEWARTSRRYFDSHDRLASEMLDLMYLEKIEYLLGVIHGEAENTWLCTNCGGRHPVFTNICPGVARGEREYDPNVAPCDDAEFGMKP